MRTPKCCVCHNLREDAYLHYFPVSDSQKLVQWLNCVNLQSLKELPLKRLGKRSVCHIHFEKRFVKSSGRLKSGAFPTLFTPEEIISGKPNQKFIDISIGYETPYTRKRHVDHTYFFDEKTKRLPKFTGLKDYFQRSAHCDHLYAKITRMHFDHNYSKNHKDGDVFSLIQGKDAEKSFLNLSGLEKVYNDHDYLNIPTKCTADLAAKAQNKKEENQIDDDAEDTEDCILEYPCDQEDLLPSSEPVLEFTTEVAPDVVESEKQVFSWEKTELIEADDPDDVTAVVPDQSKIPQDLTLSLFCEEPEPVPEPELVRLSPEPSELVAVVPEDVKYPCKDCNAIFHGFSYWCVQCSRGALCGACSAGAPHHAHHVLRAPRGAAEGRTLAVLAVIRQQMLNENMLPMYEEIDGVKVEVKQELDENPPPSPPAPAATPDPLAMELHSDPLNVSCTQPYPLPGAVFESIDGESIEHHHPYKRPRFMEAIEHTVSTQEVLKPRLLKVPTDILIGSKTIQPLTRHSNVSQGGKLASSCNPIGSQTGSTIGALRELQKYPVLQPDPSNKGESQIMLQVDPNDPIGSQTVLQVDPSNIIGSETLQVNLNDPQIVLQVDSSDPTGFQIDASTLKEIINALKNQFANDQQFNASDLNTSQVSNDSMGSETVLQIDPDDLQRLQDALLDSNNDPTRSETVIQVDPSNIKNQNVQPTYPTEPQAQLLATSRSSIRTKFLSSDRSGSQSDLNTTPYTGSSSLQEILKTRHKVTPSKLMTTRTQQKGSSQIKTCQQFQPSELRKSQNIQQFQNIPKKAVSKTLEPNDSRRPQFKVPGNVPRGTSAPVKVTSETNPEVIINLDDTTDDEYVEFLDEDILVSDNEETRLHTDERRIDEDYNSEIESVTDVDIGRRKLDNRININHDDKDEYSGTDDRETAMEDEGNHERVGTRRTIADTVRDVVESEVDDSDLDKDYRVEEDRLDSTDESDGGDSVERGIGRRTRNATKTPETSLKEILVQMQTSEAVVQMQPLTSLEIQKWTANRKRPRQD